MKFPFSPKLTLPLWAFLTPALALAAPVPIIFDTDMDSDVDDVAALCQLHAMADLGEAKILAVAISAANEHSAPCTDAINTFYGRGDLPIGVAEGERAIKQPSKYAQEVAKAFPHDIGAGQETVPAVRLYQEILAAQPDNSVTIVTVGDLTNLAALLSAEGGRELVEKKVKSYVCMGSRYPADTEKNEKRWGNFRTDPESTREVVQNWPGVITFTGGGKFADSMAIGTAFAELDEKVWPVALAYRSYFGAKGKTRHTADSIAVWVAVRGLDPYFELVTEGHNEIDEIGRNSWHPTPNDPRHQYTSSLNDPAQAPEMARQMEELAMRAPAAGVPGE